jgi:hypothetical protein
MHCRILILSKEEVVDENQSVKGQERENTEKGKGQKREGEGITLAFQSDPSEKS